MDLTKQREMWKFLGQALDHIIKEKELDKLLQTELPAYQRLEEAEEGKEVDAWWAEVAEVTLGDERQFPNLSRFTTIITLTLALTLTSTLNITLTLTRFALALATVCNSSSEVERDFSDMEAIFANSRANTTGQELLEAKMMVKSSLKNEANNCARCIAAKEDRKKRALAGEKCSAEKCQHCHCQFFNVDEDLLAKLRHNEPSKKDKERTKERENGAQKVKEADEKNTKEEERSKMRREVLRLRTIFKEKKEKAEKEKSRKNKDGVVEKTSGVVKIRKGVVPIKKVDASKKKKQLAFLL